MQPRLAVEAASKTFGRNTVLRDVGIAIEPGEIHGLVGQNGSGKSTLIRVLSGVYPPDPGARISVDGDELALPLSPREMAARGLSFVHQNLGLDDTASVIENVRIGRFAVGRFSRRIRWGEEAESVHSTLKAIGAGSVNPYALAGSLDHGARASVAIARAIQGIEPGTGCIVFDESTQSLPRGVLSRFYAQVRRLAASGTSVLLVSHRLDEVLALCDRVTVLEDGAVTLAGQPTAGMTEAGLGRAILGRSRAGQEVASGDLRSSPAAPGEMALEVRGLTGGAVHGLSFTVRTGEVVGMIGDADSGYDAVPYLISGAGRATGGEVAVGGRTTDARRMTPSGAIAGGIALVPGDRAGQGIAVDEPALDNLSLPRLGRMLGPVRSGWRLQEFSTVVQRLGLRPADPFLLAGSFSGGNQQKLLIGKWLLGRPTALVVHEPVQAVDVGARADILHALRHQADQGVAVLVVSLEAADLASLCDRVLIVRDGRVSSELGGEDLTAHALLDATYDPETPGLESGSEKEYADDAA